MTQKKAIKLFGIVLLVLIAVGATQTYLKLKEAGIIPREMYETVAPDIPEMNRPAVLVLNKTNEFIHKEGIPAADAMLKRIADSNGWDLFITNNAASHNQDILELFDLVVWNNVSGDVLLPQQRQSLRIWLQNGGGWVGIHGAGGDFSYQWRWYVETLVGAQFTGHTMEPQFQTADVLVADTESELTVHLPSPWQIADEEWYAFDQNPRHKGYEIVLTLDKQSYITTGENWMGMNDRMEGEHPIAWRHKIGEGKVFYSAIGHQAATYSLPDYEQLIGNAMSWAMSTQ